MVVRSPLSRFPRPSVSHAAFLKRRSRRCVPLRAMEGEMVDAGVEAVEEVVDAAVGAVEEVASVVSNTVVTATDVVEKTIMIPSALVAAYSGGGPSVSTLRAPQAAASLAARPGVLIDVRSAAERARGGSPVVPRGRKKKEMPYDGPRKFAERARKVKVFVGPRLVRKEKALLLILDEDGSKANEVATVFAKLGFRKCIIIKDGAEGWKNSGMDWKGEEKNKKETEADDVEDDANLSLSQ